MNPVKLQWFNHNLLVLILLVIIAGLLPSNSRVDARRTKYNKPYIVTRWFDIRGASDTPTPYSDCGSDGSDLKNVQVIPCDGDDACILKTGGNATFKLSFVSKVNSTTLKASVHGIVAGVPIPFHVPHADACTSCGIQCPLEQGKSYDYTLVLPVLSTYPKLNVIVKWELKDKNNKDVVCVEIPAKLR